MSGGARAPLFLLRGQVGGIERSYLLRPGLNRIGRQTGNHLVLPVEGVSKQHAMLAVLADGLRLQDLASKNGVFVDGRRVLDVVVRPGDALGFGPVRMHLEVASADDAELAIELPERRGASADAETTVTPPPDPAATVWRRRLRFPEGHLPGDAPPMRDLYRQMAALARSELPVLIIGETGVGKEAIAQTLHASSPRAHRPFAAINCAALPRELLEAELFGIAAGAATGVAGRAGILSAAAGGTVLLDEIGEMPVALQAKLLRVLQEKEVRPLGSPPVRLDVRVLAATNARLDELMAAGAFRRDLYYRLAGCLLEVPPLRERPDDLPALIEHLLRRAALKAGTGARGLTAGGLRRLCERPWRGNVRQLEHEVQRLVDLAAESETITERTITSAVGTDPATPPADAAAGAGGELELAAIERRAIAEALRRSAGNQARAARLLGISRYSLRRRVERHGLSVGTVG